MLKWITVARAWDVLVRIGVATMSVAAAAALQLPVVADFPGEPFLLYFVAVVASASVLGRTAGFVAVAESSVAVLILYDPVYSLKVTHAVVDLLAIEIYAVVAALSVEAFCRFVDSATGAQARLADSQARLADSQTRLADSEVQLKTTRNTEARFRATFDSAPVGCAHITPEGGRVWVNGYLCPSLGYLALRLLTTSLQD